MVVDPGNQFSLTLATSSTRRAKTQIPVSFRECVIIGVVVMIMSLGAHGQTNVVINGSFEQAFTGWTFSGVLGVHSPDYAAYDGTTWVEPSGSISQNLNTVPGRNYVLKFATHNSNTVGVRWAGGPLSTVYCCDTNLWYGAWLRTNVVLGSATSTQTTLQLESVTGPCALDAVEVGWLEEPLTITVPVPSRSTFEGGGVSFPIVVSGSPPLSYQWYKQNTPLDGATSRVLLLTNVNQGDAGEYWVRVTNNYGSVASMRAQLLVNALPKSPLIVAQPRSQSVVGGYAVGLHVVAFGEPPLAFQWRLNGVDLPLATSNSLNFAASAVTDSGTYTVFVSNRFGTTLSLPATLQVSAPVQTGGAIVVANRVLGIVDSPIYDVDGVTLLNGPTCVAQLYTGATPDNLHAVGNLFAFRTGRNAGYFPTSNRMVPDVPTYQTAYLQLRAWDSTQGTTYEEARARGGRVGKSNLSSIVIPEMPSQPTYADIRSFSLQAGVSLLATARIERGKNQPDGRPEWLLVGDAGCRYVVEHRTPPENWSPLLTVTNLTGVVSFVDPNPQNNSLKFYRAQILDF